MELRGDIMFLFKNVKSKLKRIGMNMAVYGFAGVFAFMMLAAFLPKIIANYVYDLMVISSFVAIIGSIISAVLFFIGLFVSPKNALAGNSHQKTSNEFEHSGICFFHNGDQYQGKETEVSFVQPNTSDNVFEIVSSQEFDGLISFGRKMVKCTYNDEVYEAVFMPSDKYINLLSKEPINDCSEKLNDSYITTVSINKTTEIVVEQLWVMFKNILFQVLYIDEEVVYLEVDYNKKKELNEELIKKSEFNREFNSNPYIKISRQQIEEYYVEKELYKKRI